MRKLWFRNKQLAQSHSWPKTRFLFQVWLMYTFSGVINWLGDHYWKEDIAKKKVSTFLKDPNSLMLFFKICQKIDFFLRLQFYYIRKNNPDVRSN